VCGEICKITCNGVKSSWVKKPRFVHGIGCLSAIYRSSVGIEFGAGLCGMSQVITYLTSELITTIDPVGLIGSIRGSTVVWGVSWRLSLWDPTIFMGFNWGAGMPIVFVKTPRRVTTVGTLFCVICIIGRDHELLSGNF
jgi:hypothetical protein